MARWWQARVAARCACPQCGCQSLAVTVDRRGSSPADSVPVPCRDESLSGAARPSRVVDFGRRAILLKPTAEASTDLNRIILIRVLFTTAERRIDGA